MFLRYLPLQHRKIDPNVVIQFDNISQHWVGSALILNPSNRVNRFEGQIAIGVDERVKYHHIFELFRFLKNQMGKTFVLAFS